MLQKFEILNKNIFFRIFVVLFHVSAGIHLYFLFHKQERLLSDQCLVLFYIISLAFYWKLLAKMKKQELANNQKSPPSSTHTK